MYYEKIWASDCSYLDISNCNNLYFVFCFLKESQKIIANLQIGAAQPHVYAKDLNSLSIVIPPQSILENFSSITQSIFEEIMNCQLSILNCTLARDKLLPKLMNQEIEVTA